jgi:2-polyprenyl-6-methoxyphenol hydroxylase-like FAD-dependent oxidoreductase
LNNSFFEQTAPRILDAFERSEDLYVDQLTQIRVDRWSRGRVVLVGDSAWCVTLMGGGGASLALIGGYVLAAQLDRAVPEGLGDALAAYEAWMRPLVDRVQRTPRAMVHFAYPRTRAGLVLRSVANRLVTQSLLRVLVQRLHRTKDDGQRLPAWTADTPTTGS